MHVANPLSQVEFFLNNCPPFKLDKGRKLRVCAMKWDMKKSLTEVKKVYFKFDSKDVEETYKNCPKKFCTDLLNKTICNDKRNGKTLAAILSDYPSYQEDCMKSVFRTCPLKSLSDPKNAGDLAVLCSIINILELSNLVFKKYKATYGEPALISLKKGYGKPGDLCKKTKKDSMSLKIHGNSIRLVFNY